MRKDHLAVLALLLACDGRTAESDASVDGASIDVMPDAAILNPNIIFGLKLRQWLDASESTTILEMSGSVVQWNDRSGSGNHVQAVSGSNGIQLEKSKVNGHPALQLGMKNGFFKSKSEGPNFSNPFIIAIVVGYSNPPSDMAYLYVQSSNLSGFFGKYFLANSPNGTFVFGGMMSPPNGATSTTGGWNDTRFHSLVLRANEDRSVALRVDGTESAGGMGWTSDGPLRIGGDYASLDAGGNLIFEHVLEGYIAEIIVAGGTAGTPFEVSACNAYFQSKYALPF